VNPGVRVDPLHILDDALEFDRLLLVELRFEGMMGPYRERYGQNYAAPQKFRPHVVSLFLLRRGGFVRTRDFHWAEWITPDWDEVLNPTHTEQRALYDKIVANAWRRPGGTRSHRPSICETYLRDPAAYLGARRELRPRSGYVPEAQAMAATPYALDIRSMCRR